MSPICQEISQTRPPTSPEEEALLNLMRTSDALSRAFQHAIKPFGITSTQYNVLRILRGAQPNGCTCSEIGTRLLTSDPDITRLLSRLKKLSLIGQQRDKADRRVVRTQIRTKGLELLASMDETVTSLPLNLLSHFSPNELTEFIRLLEKARQKTTCPSQSAQSEQHTTATSATVSCS